MVEAVRLLERGDATAEDIDIAMKLGAVRSNVAIFDDAHERYFAGHRTYSPAVHPVLLYFPIFILAMGPIELTDFVGLDTSASYPPLVCSAFAVNCERS